MGSDFHGGEIKENIIYDFSVNLNPLGMPEYVKSALADNIDCGSQYPDRFCLELRKQIASYEEVQPEQIVCGNGASELIMAVCAFASSKQRVKALVQAPTFSGYERGIRAYQGEVNYFRNFNQLKEMMGEENYNLLFLCNPNNPTGEIISADTITELLFLAKEKQILVVVDESFIEFTKETSVGKELSSFNNLIILKAFTKFYSMAGLRLGYLCAEDSLCREIKTFLPEWNVSSLAQVAGTIALSDTEQNRIWKEKTISLIEKEREYLKQELRFLGIQTSDSKTNYLLCQSEHKNLWEKLRAQGILVRDCSNYRELDSFYFRICVSTHEKNEKLIQKIKELI